MNFARFVRQSHRWIAIVFTLTVAVNFAAMPLAGPDGVPAGIVVALIGAPYFIYLLLKK